MAQYKKIDVTIYVKETALGGAQSKALFPTRENSYTETVDGSSLKAVRETVCAGLLEQLVASQEATIRIDRETGVRVKVAYRVNAVCVGSVSAAGVSNETGAAAISRGKAAGRKLSRNARKRAARRAAAKAA